MKNIWFIGILSVLLTFGSCGSQKTVTDENSFGVNVTSIKNISIDTLIVTQLDSLTNTDKLPEYSKWNKTYLKDADSNKAYEYGTIYDSTSGIIYTVKFLKDKTVYVVSKKQTKH